MFKIIIVILFFINISACEPIQKASIKQNIQKKTSFTCLKSQSECEIHTESGDFIVQFSGEALQERIKTELPFQIQIKLDENNEAYRLREISSYLEGKTMFMGKIPIFFEIDKSVGNSMIAESLLASCSEEVMTWRLWVQVEIISDGKVQQQNFFIDFDSQRL